MMFIVQEAIRSGIMDGMKELNIRIIWHLLLSQPEKYHMLQVFGKSKLESDEVNETRRLLKRYDSISLRELSGVEIVD